MPPTKFPESLALILLVSLALILHGHSLLPDVDPLSLFLYALGSKGRSAGPGKPLGTAATSPRLSQQPGAES